MTGTDPSLVPIDPAQNTSEQPNPVNTSTPLEVREKAGLTMPEMARLIGMSELGYRLWEQGARRPGGPAFKLLALLDAHPKDTVARLQEQS